MRNFFIGLLVVAISFSGRLAAPDAFAVTLVKSASGPAVYYVDNGKRYAFPNENVFQTWNFDFSQVATVSDADLSALSLAGNMTVRPGSEMVKIQSDPKTYEVSSGGTLRWVTSEAVAIALHGTNWKSFVHDISDAFFVNYSVGPSISSVNDYSPIKELADNQVFNSLPAAPAASITPLPNPPVAVTPAGCASGNPSCAADERCVNNACVRDMTPSGVIAEYLTCMSDNEKAAIDADFDLQFVDTAATVWSAHPYVCDFSTKEPTRLPIYNALRLLKNISFSQPLPFTDGASVYDFLTLKTISPDIYNASSKRLRITPATTCDVLSYAFNNLDQHTTDPSVKVYFDVYPGGSSSRLYPTRSGDTSCQDQDPLLGKDSPVLLNESYYNPVYLASLIVHESYHTIASKWHDGPNGADKTIDQMGAWAAQFYFQAWVALYSTNVDANTKELAKEAAAGLLNANRFSDSHCPSDQSLKLVVNQISPGTCQ